MKVHPPKAVDSWREFFVEIVVIVIGIGLALGAEEVISDYHSDKEVEVVQDSLDDELEGSLFAARERLKLADCQQRTLAELDDLVHSGGGTVQISDAAVSPVRLWGSAAWDAAVASGIVENMEHDQRHDYAQLFSIVSAQREWNVRERELWAIVSAYGRTPPASVDARHRLAEAVSQLQALNVPATRAARQFVEAAGRLDLQLSAADRAALAEPVSCSAPASAP